MVHTYNMNRTPTVGTTYSVNRTSTVGYIQYEQDIYCRVHAARTGHLLQGTYLQYEQNTYCRVHTVRTGHLLQGTCSTNRTPTVGYTLTVRTGNLLLQGTYLPVTLRTGHLLQVLPGIYYAVPKYKDSLYIHIKFKILGDRVVFITAVSNRKSGPGWVSYLGRGTFHTALATRY